jgi:sRNA-binding regulator protein Hfq
MTGNRLNHDPVRREQMEEGARMAREEGASEPIIYRGSSSKRTYTPGRKEPAKPKGHEAFLKALETSGTQIQLEKMSGEIVVGTVKHSDKYTITVRYEAGTGEIVNRVIFKHDISEFRALQPKPDTTVEDGAVH